MTEQIQKMIEAEREHQVAQWGGSAHDDRHCLIDWADFITKQNRKLVIEAASRSAEKGAYQRLVKIAAIAIAALESWERGAPGMAPLRRPPGASV